MKKISVYLILIALFFQVNVNSQTQQGFFLDDWTPKSIKVDEYVEVVKPSQVSTDTITADFDNVVTKVSKYLYGTNANDYSGKYNANPDMVSKVMNLNPNVIRFPGGNNANWYFWDRSTGSWPSDIPLKGSDGGSFPYLGGRESDNWKLNLNDYYQFLQQTNSTGIITVNYSYARYSTAKDPVAVAAKYAADWVRFDNGRTKFWEVGNENYGTWQPGYSINTATNKDGQPAIITGELYGKHFQVFADSMHAAAAQMGLTIYVGAVGYDALNPGGGVISGWNENVLPQVKGKADFYIVHNYYTNYQENTNSATILNSALNGATSSLTTVNTRMDEAGYSQHLPVVLTEWNIQAVGAHQMVSHVNGLHANMALGDFIKTGGYGLATRWGLANYYANDGDDQGMFTWGAEPGVPVFNARPVFYHMYYFQKYFGDKMISSSKSGSPDVVAFASKFSSSGQASFVIVNKGTTDGVVELKVNNFNVGARYYVYTLTGDGSEFSRKVFVNGQTTTLPAGGPENYATLKPNSALISGGIKISAPARSSCYVLIDGADSAPIQQLSKIVVGPDSASMGIGQTFQFNASGYDLANVRQNILPKWSVSGGGTINANGLFYANTEGSYRIYAGIGNLLDSAVVTVNPACKLVVSPDTVTIITGATFQFSAQGYDKNNVPLNVTPIWTVADSASIDASGLFTATKKGIFKVIATQGNLIDSAFVTVVPPKPCTIFNLNDKIEAESYCRMSGIQTESSTDIGAGSNVGYIDAGDWIEYPLNVETGTYLVDTRIAAKSAVGKFSLILLGGDCDTLVINAPLEITGDWQNWKTVTTKVDIKVNGLHTLRIYSSIGGWNLNWIQFSKVTTIKNVENQPLSYVYPNPLTDNSITIVSQLLKSNGVVTVRIADSLGRTAFMESLTSNFNEKCTFTIPKALSPGIYILSIISSNTKEDLKLLVK